MPDPILTSARDLLRRARDDMRAAIDGLPPDALNWRPAGADTNSIAAMANHALTSARTWLSVAVDAPLPPPPPRPRPPHRVRVPRPRPRRTPRVRRRDVRRVPRSGGRGAHR